MERPVETIEGKNLEKLWVAFKVSGDIDAKNELLVHYTYLAKSIVRRMMPKYNSYNEYDDLVNCGIIGLIDAVEKFDLKHGVKFETYAVTRIKGEIIDYMRSQDWAPSSLRKKINVISETFETLESRNGATPSDMSVAKELDMPVEQVQKVLVQTHIFNVVNFEDTLNSYAAKEIAAAEGDEPESILMQSELKRILAEVIDQLSEKEKLVVTLYYYEEMMLKEIAEILGVSESRVSQMHSKVLAKMRIRMQKVL